MARKDKDQRNRNWTFLVYPDSAPHNWKEILSDDLKLLWVQSPLHEYDVNEDGTPKKPHWHIVVCHEGNKSYEQILEISEAVNGTDVKPVSSMHGLIQYFIHKNNPEKFQYKKEDIEPHGIDISPYFGLSSSQIQAECRKMIDYIEDNDVSEFSDFVVYCHNISQDWEYIIMNRNTSFFKAYLYNRAMKKKQQVQILQRAQNILEVVSNIEARIQQAENKYLCDKKGI